MTVEKKSEKKVPEILKKICVKQVRSIAKCTKDQIACVKGLGLRKIGDISVLQDSSCVRGMIRKVSHLVSIDKNAGDCKNG